MNPAAHFLIHSARPLGRPVIPAREERKQRACHQYIMEMRNHIISAVHRDIERRHRQNESGKAAHRKDKDKADREQHGRLKTQRAAPHCRNPVEDLTPVGTEISIVAYIKNNSLDTGMPVANIWCAQTINDRIAIAATAYTIEL